jgi:pre-mRNA-splicing factor SPF27
LLETYGKNAWLVANWDAEAELKSLEEELKVVKGEAEALAQARAERQAGAAAEMSVLEESWKKGIRGVVEVQIASEQLRGEVLEARRRGVGN